MKYILILMLLLSTACADLSDDVRRLENRVTDLEDRMRVLEGNYNSFVIVAQKLSEQIANLNNDVAVLAAQLDNLPDLSPELGALQAQIDALNTQLNGLETQQNLLQAQTDTMQLQITELALAENIDTFLDPCGDEPNEYDEVLLRTTSGKVVAYFEHGSKRFLSILSANTAYETTDKSKCKFSLDVNGNLIYAQ